MDTEVSGQARGTKTLVPFLAGMEGLRLAGLTDRVTPKEKSSDCSLTTIPTI